MNKKAENILLNEVIFFVLNVVFFGLFLFFAVNSSTGAFALEQFYTKQIAILIDGAEPGTTIRLDVSDAYEIAKENNIGHDKMFRVQDNKVIVQLSGSRSYGFSYYNDVDVAISRDLNEEKFILNLLLTENE